MSFHFEAKTGPQIEGLFLGRATKVLAGKHSIAAELQGVKKSNTKKRNISPDKKRDHVTNHHEAGHAGVMGRHNVPILYFERSATGQAEIVPGPFTASSPSEQVRELYFRLLAVRASRYSQKLSQHNSALFESQSFTEDEKLFEKYTQTLFTQFRSIWGKEGPLYLEFKQALLDVIRADLALAFSDAPYKVFIKRIAAALHNINRMEGPQVIEMVNNQWKASGATLEFSGYEEFLTICTTGRREAVDGE